MIAVKTKAMEILTESCRQKEESKAIAETDLANVSEELHDTTKTIRDDTKKLDEAKAACAAKAAEWNKRVRAHSEELVELQKALETLTSD